MRPDIQRLELAKLDGYTSHPFEDYRWRQQGEDWISEDCLPDYLHDLNAIHELEIESKLHIDVEGKSNSHRYWHNLLDITHREGKSNIHCATAAQRSEAILRTFGKWKED